MNVVCERCNMKRVKIRRIVFEGRPRDLCPDCSASFVRWFGRDSRRSGPPEREEVAA